MTGRPDSARCVRRRPRSRRTFFGFPGPENRIRSGSNPRARQKRMLQERGGFCGTIAFAGFYGMARGSGLPANLRVALRCRWEGGEKSGHKTPPASYNVMTLVLTLQRNVREDRPGRGYAAAPQGGRQRSAGEGRCLPGRKSRHAAGDGPHANRTGGVRRSLITL